MNNNESNFENKKLAELLFGGINKSIADYEAEYPPRNLPVGAMVTRFAPSPTGFVHIGSLLPSLVNERLARQSNGVFYLRIEDTDKKREVEDGIAGIVKSLSEYGIFPDEGATEDGIGEKGSYGPYKQSNRTHIYHCFAKSLVERGLAYPCFCSEDELADIRKKQEAVKADPGYYGEWAIHRDTDPDTVYKLLDNKTPYVLRLRAPEKSERKVVFHDLVKGRLELPENHMDIVLLKSDGTPTYHFAHAVDDHLMRTTHVIRGDEWLSSIPIHLQLFEYFNWTPPTYAHLSPVMKDDGNSRRKLSKRKDPEAAVLYYHEKGYPVTAVQDYLLNLINSNFEDWRRDNPKADNRHFKVGFEKMSVSGALFDLVKLNDISSNTIALLSAEDVYGKALKWAEEYDGELASILRESPEYAISIFAIERGGPKPRKDISMWSQVRNYISYFYDSLFDINREISENNSLDGCRVTTEDVHIVIDRFLSSFDIKDSVEVWFEKIKVFSDELGYTKNMKEYRKNPSAWKGNVSDVCTLLRVGLTGRKMTPDLWSIMQVLGADRVRKRLIDFKNNHPR